MDISQDGSIDQPSPATTSNSASRGGSTSHTSYSPGNQQGDIQNIAFRNSPKNLSGQIPLPQTTTSNGNTNYFPMSDDMFSAAPYSNPGPAMNDDSMNNAFLGVNEWDMNALGNAPMSEGTWNQMLENINLGWDTLGPPHGEIPEHLKNR
jgi:hypothetical protein